jgi:excisionase family DNA binding protein
MIMQHLEISPNTYYTPEEAAAMLRVSRRSVQNLLNTGLARGVKIGRNWRILGRDLLQLPRADEVADAELTRSLMHLSEPAFMKVWDNDEDAVYDAL